MIYVHYDTVFVAANLGSSVSVRATVSYYMMNAVWYLSNKTTVLLELV